MKKRFKKIYIEITNRCNLNCSFCPVSKRKKEEMSIEHFAHIINQIKPYGDYVYLHVKGEPLLHSNLDGILDLCDEALLKVNITTNATMIKEKMQILMNHDCLRQINVSLHSENEYPNYFDIVFENCKLLSTKMFISYRLWTLENNKMDEKNTEIVEKLKKAYRLSTEVVDKIMKDKQIKIDINTYVNKDNLFEWPKDDKNIKTDGYCLGLIDQIGILVNGDVVPCCLDGEGIIKLGNIFDMDFKDIINSELATSMIDGFYNNKCFFDLCKSCTFKNKFNK